YRSCSLSFLPLPAPPSSPLFPYTTLFRSQVAPRREAPARVDTGPGEDPLHGRNKRKMRYDRRQFVNAILDAARFHPFMPAGETRSEEHTSELQSLTNLVCRLLLEKKKAYI